MDSEPLLATGSPFLPPILNFQQPFHFFCTDSLFLQQIHNNAATIAQTVVSCLITQQLFDARGGLSGSHPVCPYTLAAPVSAFSVLFFGLIFRSLFFYKKCILGAKRCFKMAPKLTREATSELIFTFSSEP
jgi:hypothetical protein